jgi:hypothetical protein
MVVLPAHLLMARGEKSRAHVNAANLDDAPAVVRDYRELMEKVNWQLWLTDKINNSRRLSEEARRFLFPVEGNPAGSVNVARWLKKVGDFFRRFLGQTIVGRCLDVVQKHL